MKEGKFFEQKEIHRRPIMIGEGVGDEEVNSRPSTRGLFPSSVYTHKHAITVLRADNNRLGKNSVSTQTHTHSRM